MSRSRKPSRKPARLTRLAVHVFRRRPTQSALVLVGVLALTNCLPLPLRTTLIALGVIATGSFLAFVGLWGLTRFRSLARAAPTALMWAFRLALVVSVLGAGGLNESLHETLGVTTSPSFMLFVGVPLFAVLFVVLFVGGMLAAALGYWSGRKRLNPAASAREAIAAWWTGTLILVIAALMLKKLVPESAFMPLWLGLVPGTLAWTSRGNQSGLSGDPLTAKVARRLARLRRPSATGTRPLWDPRGAILGAAGATLSLLLTLGPGSLLAPVQYQALEGLLRFRNEPTISQRGWGPISREGKQSAIWRRRIVIAEMDPGTRRIARTTGSESRVLAQTLERLGKLRPQRIVTPLPQLDANWLAGSNPEIDAPPANEVTVSRNVKDLPRLESALRNTPRALLATPRFIRPSPELSKAANAPRRLDAVRLLTSETKVLVERLIRAAPEAADAGTDWYGTHRLPFLRLSSKPQQAPRNPDLPFDLPAAAVTLLLASQGPDSFSVGMRQDRVRIGARWIPLLAPGLTPVDYGGPEPLQAFPHVSFGSILRGDSVYETESSGHPGVGVQTGRWRTAGEYYSGKIVLLTPLDQERVETPAGALTPTEILAHAIVTLASGQLIRPLPGWLFICGVLALGTGVGLACAGATPLMVSWRGGMALLFPLVLAPAGILLSWWIDPIAPLAAVAISIALVTQIEQDDFQRQRALLERVAAPQVVDELLARPGQLALGGERREVCILFADVRGFTQFSEGHTADEVITIINRYTSALTEVLLAHGGILDHYTGDGLVARFELLHAPEEDLRRAVCAALAMRDAAEAIAARQERDGGEPLRLGMGVHCGEAVVGLVGSLAQFNYTAMGHTVVVAARLQGVAGGGELLISDEVYRMVGANFRCEPCEPVMAKGLSEPIRAYRVLSAPSEGLGMDRSSEMEVF